MNSHAHEIADAFASSAATPESLTAGAVADVLRDLLGLRPDTHQPADPIRNIAICGDRVAVHLAVQASGATELAELEATVAARIRALGATGVDVLIRRPDVSPSSLTKQASRNPWTDRVRLASIRH